MDPVVQRVQEDLAGNALMARMALCYRCQDGSRWGYVDGAPPVGAGDVVVVRPIVTDAMTTAELIGALDATELPSEPTVQIPARQLLSPVTADATIFGQAFNYAPSAAEAAKAPRSRMLFMRSSSALSGPYDPIIRPAEVELLDYEAEIGIVVRAHL